MGIDYHQTTRRPKVEKYSPMQYTSNERELPASPLKNTTNAADYASKESPMRSPGSHSKARKLVKSKTTGSNASLKGYSPSPTKKQAENQNSGRSNE